MINSNEIRWQQRYETFGQALAQLSQACAKDELNDLERTGLIKTFEICFELAWKVLKDLLFFEGFDDSTPRAILRKSFIVQYIDESDCEVLLDALDKRNLLSHTYTGDLAAEFETLIRDVYHPVLENIHQKLGAKRTP